MSDYKKELAELYEQYEEQRTKAKEHQDSAKDIKNKMTDILETTGVDFVVVPGLDHDAMKLFIDVQEREGINKKKIADKLDVKVKDINDLEKWFQFVREGKITEEMINDAKYTEEIETFKAEVYSEDE